MNIVFFLILIMAVIFWNGIAMFLDSFFLKFLMIFIDILFLIVSVMVIAKL